MPPLTSSTVPPTQEGVGEKTKEIARMMNIEPWQLVAILVGKCLTNNF